MNRNIAQRAIFETDRSVNVFILFYFYIFLFLELCSNIHKFSLLSREKPTCSYLAGILEYHFPSGPPRASFSTAPRCARTHTFFTPVD
ncbi:hypothetical protein PUN28_008566 [Cardiocondyla obscurior]|uniref:Uncharacterized protein n=1 Tax=Cardiocondyla obscurior TaxID=286306 RepID=A0AAW2G353_9HYME